MIDASERFREHMRSVGFEPPPHIERGRFHRMPGVDKRPGNTAGWCKLFDDGRGGVFGDYSTGLSEFWQSERTHSLAPAERESFWRQVRETKAQAETKRRTEEAQAARIASERWEAATP